ncbi:hypothetical protein BY996DRAFT_6430273 [Phakopsora pachyrhizi]|nr:hypothetical protein BY996DRAFT_6430273 [Phakopsora pachyrhizi]
MFPERDYNYEDLKGIMTVAIYHGLHSVCGHFVSLCLVLKLHKVFVKLTDVNLRGTATEEELVEKGRTWLLVVIYSHIHVELVVILANAQDKLDVRNYPGPVEQRRSNYVVPELLDDWYEEWRFRAPELFVFETRLGLVTGYLLWICQVIPGYIELRDYRQLLGRLHSIDFHDSCEYIDLIEESISRIDEILGIGVIEDRMANELERLMTDTRFWFQIDIDVEF